VTFFLDILSLPATTADGIEMSLLQCLNANANGFSDDYLQECFIGLAADGASVMLGFRTGRSCQPNLLSFFDQVSESVDTGTAIDVIFLDFAKAFDKVPHFTSGKYRELD